jgi:hypothetical protein
VSAWADGAALVWAGGAALALLVLREWEWSVRLGSLVPAELLGRAEALGPEEASGQADGPEEDGLAGGVDAGGRGVWVPVPSRWLRRGLTTVVTDTVTVPVSNGCPIGAG